MARPIGPLPYRKVARALGRFGFAPVRQVGSHERWKHPDGRAATLPRHEGRDLDPWLIHKILREARIEADAFLEEV